MRKQVKFQKYEWEQNLRMTLIYCRLYRCRKKWGSSWNTEDNSLGRKNFILREEFTIIYVKCCKPEETDRKVFGTGTKKNGSSRWKYGFYSRDHELYKLLSSYISTGILEGFSNLDGFIDNLALCALIHKHPTFTAEKEIRIAPYFVTDNDPHIEYKTFNIIKEFYILDLQKVLETENMHREDIINSIIIGPRSSQNPKDLENYCRHLGLHKLAQNIKVSDCPLR